MHGAPGDQFHVVVCYSFQSPVVWDLYVCLDTVSEYILKLSLIRFSVYIINHFLATSLTCCVSRLVREELEGVMMKVVKLFT